MARDQLCTVLCKELSILYLETKNSFFHTFLLKFFNTMQYILIKFSSLPTPPISHAPPHLPNPHPSFLSLFRKQTRKKQNHVKKGRNAHTNTNKAHNNTGSGTII